MFSPHKSDHGSVLPWEYMPANAGTYQAGQLLNATAGKLTTVGEASKVTPGYLCMANITVSDGDSVPVTRIQDDVVYETQLSAQASGAVIGAKLQVSAGGLQVDATAAGSFELVYADGTEAGSMVRGRFI